MRDYPYGNFNFQVKLGPDADETKPSGGFSDVQGISTEVTYAEQRLGNAPTNTTSKYPNVFKLGTLTLKRGVIGADDLWAWVKQARDGAYVPRPISVTLLDEEHKGVMRWDFVNAQPQKWTAPTMAGKGGTDVAIEELVLVYEGYELTLLQ
jgi:phage tail-like protein